MKALIAILFASSIFGQIPASSVMAAGNVTASPGFCISGSILISNITPQQFDATYTCPTSAAATIAVVDHSGLVPVVNDVDPTKFANSNLDTSRTNTVTSGGGLTRTVEIGLRASGLALDGNLYSRSLQ